MNRSKASTSTSAAPKQPTTKSKVNEKKTAEYTSNIVRTKRYGNHDFLEDDKGFVHVYTDGSCENNGNSNAIAGYGVYFGENHALYVPFIIILISTLF